MGTEPILLEKDYVVGNELWRFQTVKFYISAFTTISEKGTQAFPTKLIDLEVPSSQSLGQIDSAVARIDFLLGTDSLSNVSGILEGPLDPINGMYWAWNSGYINLKAEGTIQDSTGNTSLFEFHIGGYMPPNATVQALSFELDLEKQDPIIAIQMNEWMEFAFEKGIHSLMIPGKTAVELANRIQSSIHLIYGND